jgi:hypothetical protein
MASMFTVHAPSAARPLTCIVATAVATACPGESNAPGLAAVTIA